MTEKNKFDSIELDESTMEFVNEELDDAVQQKPKKKNIFKRIGGAIATGFRKVRESPVAAAIGLTIGAVGGVGGTLYYGKKHPRYVTMEVPVEVEKPVAIEPATIEETNMEETPATEEVLVNE